MKKPCTEDIHPDGHRLDNSLETINLLTLFTQQEEDISKAVHGAIREIEKACDSAIQTVGRGGRIFYIGAGTSGRLGMMDAAEIRPTFGVRKGIFNAIIAGGHRALRESIEDAEDNSEEGREAVRRLTAGDMAFGISASGTTPFVLAALREAKKIGAMTCLLSCNPVKKPVFTDILIQILTGPELIAGSTRLKAASATKMVLNMFSSVTMIKLGSLYKGMMIDVIPSNKKLAERAARIIMNVTNCNRRTALQYLKKSGNKPKVACVMIAKGVSQKDAETMLEKASGFLDKVL